MKIIRIFLVFVAVSFVIGVGTAFNGKNNPKTSPDNETKTKLSTNTVEVSKTSQTTLTNDESKKESQKEELKETSTNQKQKAKDIEHTQKQPVNNEQKENKVVENTSKEVVKPKEEVKEQPKEEVKEQVKEEVVVKEVIVDTELEKLKTQVEYATYDSCMDDGFRKSLEDTVNILGFSCPYVVYKGEILGYRLNLDYTNPMNN